jgi:hypothetical protein
MKRRKEKGTAALELVAGLFLLVPLTLLGINVCTLGMASFFNDQAAKEAARAAAEQTTLVTATQVARTIVKQFAIANGAISSPHIAAVEYTYFDKPDGTPIELGDLTKSNISKAPSVSVTTRLSITTPAPILVHKGKLTNTVVLVSQHSYPLMSGVDPDPNAPDGVGDDVEPPSGPGDNDPGDDDADV